MPGTNESETQNPAVRGGSDPFFSAEEWRMLAILRPREWRQGWAEIPIALKAIAIVIAAASVWAVYEIIVDDADLGLLVLATLVAPYFCLALLFVLCQVAAAASRRLLRRMGLLDGWRAIRGVFLAAGKLLLWSTFLVAALIGILPYLSVDPTKTWYAVTRNVPAKNIEVKKKPKDCAFTTAPLGNKNCHYAARIKMLNARENPSPVKFLVVTYERVEE